MQGAGVAVISLMNQGSTVLLAVANLLINGYPILLQRYNRVRVHAALRRVAATSG